jgi:hypothetical protein
MDMALVRQQFEQAGLDWPSVKEGLRRWLPLFELIAARTPNKVDDAAVQLIRLIVTNGD